MLGVMSDTECRRCGSPMVRGGVCPVCEMADDGASIAPPTAASSAASGTAGTTVTVELPAATPLARLWQSGRLAVGVSAACFVLATVIPLVSVQRVGVVAPRVGRSALAMILGQGPFGREMHSSALLAVPAAAIALLSFLITRRTRSVMLATRPLLLAVAVIPLLAATLPVLKLDRRHRFDYELGPAVAVIALGTLAGVIGAVRFGRGTSDPPPRRRAGRDEDDDQE